MSESLLQQGFELMLYGMGVVFVFLTLLVFATTLMSSVTNRYFPEDTPEAKPSPQRGGVATSNDAAVISAISIAVAKYRKDRKN